MPIELDVIGVDIHTPARDTQRDRWGRYLIPDPANGKVKGWTRATTVAKTLDDGAALTSWAKRTVAVGVAGRASIAAGVVAAQGDKRRLDELVEQAMEAAGGNDRRELGTALHRILELVDTGLMSVDDVPDPWRADVVAYREALDRMGLTVLPEWCEAVLLNEPLGVAGTCDRILVDRTGQLVVADIKTGTFVGWLSFAVQFALYATASHVWDPASSALRPAPTMRQDHAILLHVPAGEGRCEIEALSVPVGLEAAKLALQVRAMRQRDRRHHVALDGWDEPAPARPDRSVRHDFGAAATPAPVVEITAEPMMSDEQRAELRRRVDALEPEARAVLDAIAREARDCGRPISIGAGATLTRWHLYRAMLRLAAHFGADLEADHVRATVAAVVPDAAMPGVTLGLALGSLELDEAQALVAAAVGVIAHGPALQIDDSGCVRWLDRTA